MAIQTNSYAKWFIPAIRPSTVLWGALILWILGQSWLPRNPVCHTIPCSLHWSIWGRSDGGNLVASFTMRLSEDEKRPESSSTQTNRCGANSASLREEHRTCSDAHADAQSPAPIDKWLVPFVPGVESNYPSWCRSSSHMLLQPSC